MCSGQNLQCYSTIVNLGPLNHLNGAADFEYSFGFKGLEKAGEELGVMWSDGLYNTLFEHRRNVALDSVSRKRRLQGPRVFN